jgi:TorA maturation chaperone TorD
MMTTATVAIHHPVEPEDQVRADLYGLLARLYADAPDVRLLAALAAAPRMDDGGAPFARAYNRLIDASAVMDPDAATQEYTELFIGVGKCEVNLHASHWITGFMMEKPLAELRAELAALGLGRRSGVTRLEDHLSALLETLRILVAGQENRRPASLPVQRDFFERWIVPLAPPCCDAINKSAIANYYRCVAELTTTFVAIERDSLAMD